MKKMPPLEKVYEAWTAIIDNRVSLFEDYALVSSSDGAKKYTVRFEGDTYSSDDNATYWRGYPGYPVLAVLMLQGKLPYNKEEAEKFRKINWTETNKKFKNNYSAAVKYVEKERDIDSGKASEAANKVMEALENLPLTIKRKIKVV